MATTANGAPASSAVKDSTIVEASAPKRKRDDALASIRDDDAAGLGRQQQKDILEVIRVHDTEPSFLSHLFEDIHGSQPSTKKPKLSDPSDKQTTISAKLGTGSYLTLGQLEQDAAKVNGLLADEIRTRDKPKDGQTASRPSSENLKRIQRCHAFEQLVRAIVAREKEYEAAHGRKETDVKTENAILANGDVPDDNPKSGIALTLFGSAPTPKQLFSSLQDTATSRQDSNIKAELPVEEMGLPTGLSATKIMPSTSGVAKEGPTIAKVFPPSYSLAQLHPPKAHKRASARDNVITWDFKDHVSRGSKRGGYTTQSLTVGDWLSYGGLESAQDATSTREKRKQRDRALSTGEAVQSQHSKSPATLDPVKREEALFRRAFSSFAPSRDNSKSIVSEGTKSMVWWHKIGNRRYDASFALDPALQESSTIATIEDQQTEEQEFNDQNFEQIIENLQDLDDDVSQENARDKTDTEQVLREISELLETLASHQRIRNATLAASTSVSRTPISPAATIAAKIGRPDSPAEEEINTYNRIRHEIAYLVLKLPPYAVAKLDGDQLADLGVSKLITFESDDYQGQMEEDQVTRMSKYTAAAAAAGVASLTRQNSASNPHYSSGASRTPAIGQAANTRYGQVSGYGVNRTPSTAPTYQRSNSGQSSYATPSAGSRAQYPQTTQQTRPSAPQQSYGQMNGQQFYQQRAQQTPAANYGSYGQGYNRGTPQTQPRTGYSSSQPLQQFQQRIAQANSMAFNNANSNSQAQASQSPYQRNASPAQKPAGYAASPQATQMTSGSGQQPPRPAYPMAGGASQGQQYAQQQPGSGRTTPNNQPSQSNTPVNGVQQAVAPPPSVQPRAASGTPQPAQANQGLPNGHA